MLIVAYGDLSLPRYNTSLLASSSLRSGNLTRQKRKRPPALLSVNCHSLGYTLHDDDVAAAPTGSPVIGLVSTPSSTGGIGIIGIIAMFFVVTAVIAVIATLYSSWEG